MDVGLIGLGKMGQNIALNLIENDVITIVYNRTSAKVDQMVENGARGAYSLRELVEKLKIPRLILIMVPAGSPVDEILNVLTPLLIEGDILIDGGNSFYKDSIKRAAQLNKKGIFFLDMGTSGGLLGARHGASLTIGGEEKAFQAAEPLIKVIAADDGYCYTGPTGSGHFVKMVHNGIEYAMLQAYGEGFELLNNGPYDLDFSCIAKAWNNGGVIRSWLLELAIELFGKDPKLDKVSGVVGGGETGEWTVKTGIEYKTPLPLINTALQMRYRSRKEAPFSGRVIAALRHRFGGHAYINENDN